MTWYSLQSRDRVFVKGYEFFSIDRNMGKSIGKNMSKIFSGNYWHKVLDHGNQPARDSPKIDSKRTMLETLETIGYLTVNKIAARITKMS